MASLPPRWRRLRRVPLPAALLAVLVVAPIALLGAPAAADPPTVAQLEAQIDKVWRQLEPVIERHNETRLQLAAKRRTAAALATKMEPLQRQVDAALAQVGQLAALAYKGRTASAVNSLLSSGSPTEFSARLSVLDQFAQRQEERVAGVVALRLSYAQRKKPLDALIGELSRTEAQLAARAGQIDAEIKKLERLRLQAYGGTGGTGRLRPVPCPVTYPGGAAGKVIKFACAQIGKPYSWGASGPGSYDCSGLTGASWATVGVGLPHNAAAQRRAVPSVKRSALRPGDLVFYYADLHHVALYAGRINGVDWIVHAPQAGEPLTMRRMDAGGSIHSYGRPG